MSEAIISIPNFSQSNSLRMEFINLDGWINQKTYLSLWTPTGDTPFRVFVTTTRIAGNLPYDFGAIDCFGDLESLTSGTTTLTVSLTEITLNNSMSNISHDYRITGTAYYNA